MDTNNESTMLPLLLSNQVKILAGQQTLMIQQTRLLAALTGVDEAGLMEVYEELYSQEKNKLHLAVFAELRGLQGGRQTDTSGGGLGGAG